MATSEYDLLQRFVNNEKKSRIWTLFSVIAFCCFAFGVIYLANRLNDAHKTINNQQADLLKALEKANLLNDSLNENQVSLKNMSDAYNQSKQENDSLLALLKKVSESGSSSTEKTHIQMIVKNTLQVNKLKPKYKIYIQYMRGYEDESKIISRLLLKDYNVPGTENVTKISFPSSIRYFNNGDKAEAQKIADLININIDKFKNEPIKITKTYMNVPKGQLEVWLGNYRVLNTKQIIEKYSIQKMN